MLAEKGRTFSRIKVEEDEFYECYSDEESLNKASDSTPQESIFKPAAISSIKKTKELISQDTLMEPLAEPNPDIPNAHIPIRESPLNRGSTKPILRKEIIDEENSLESLSSSNDSFERDKKKTKICVNGEAPTPGEEAKVSVKYIPSNSSSDSGQGQNWPLRSNSDQIVPGGKSPQTPGNTWQAQSLIVTGGVNLLAYTDNTLRRKLLPEKFISTKISKKNFRDFEGLHLVQSMKSGNQPIWVIEFSHDGNYLAAGGKDGVLRIWEVTNSEYYSSELLFNRKSLGDYIHHEGDIVGISWNEINPKSLMTCSLDATCGLWEVSDSNTNMSHKPIKIYHCTSGVTGIHFLPNSTSIFITGSLDGYVRLWTLDARQEEAIVDYASTQELISSLACSPNGTMLLVGLFCGECVVYSVDTSPALGLNYLSRIDCKNRKGTFKKGRKVSGICFLDDTNALITTNDHRIRYIDIHEFKQKFKYKGHKNKDLPMRASLSPDEQFFICGSEDKNLYIWTRENKYIPSINPAYTGFKADRIGSTEIFKPFEGKKVVTQGIFAPHSTTHQKTVHLAKYVPESFLSHIIICASFYGDINVYYNEMMLNKTKRRKSSSYVMGSN